MLKIDGVNYQNKQYSVKNNSNYLAYANNNQTHFYTVMLVLGIGM